MVASLVASLILSTSALLAGSEGPGNGTLQLAQTSCKAMQAMCAARCKQRVPDDKNCVSDHCTPKLVECRSTGCWQEGRQYGGKLSCNLSKS